MSLTGYGDELVFKEQSDESFAERIRLVGQRGRDQRGQKRRSRVGRHVGQMTARVLAGNHCVRVICAVRDHFENANAWCARVVFAGCEHGD